MDGLDWFQPIGGTDELLACVPGLGLSTFHAWRRRGVVILSDSGPGTGRASLYLAADVLQAAVAHELAGQTTMVAWTRAIWTTFAGVIRYRNTPLDKSNRDRVIAVRALPNGLLRTWEFREGEPLPGDLPAAALVIQIDRLIDAVAARILALQLIPAA